MQRARKRTDGFDFGQQFRWSLKTCIARDFIHSSENDPQQLLVPNSVVREDFFGKKAHEACDTAKIVQFFIESAAEKNSFTFDLPPHNSDEKFGADSRKN